MYPSQKIKNRFYRQIDNTTLNVSNNSFTNKHNTSGASRNIFQLKSPLPLQSKLKSLLVTTKSRKGRSNNGQIVCYTKGRVSVTFKYPQTKGIFRVRYLFFIAGIFLVPLKLKTFSLVFTSSGQITYLYSNRNHIFFRVYKLYSIFEKFRLRKKQFFLPKLTNIARVCYLILQLPKNKLISLLEIYPTKGVQYVRSPGSKAFLKKINVTLGAGLIKLPSGVHKSFSVFSMGSEGSYPYDSKKTLRHTKTRFMTKLGKKSIVRGVAKNPVDHPHGGRAKSIRYQRTPWGKTTKYK